MQWPWNEVNHYFIGNLKGLEQHSISKHTSFYRQTTTGAAPEWTRGLAGRGRLDVHGEVYEKTMNKYEKHWKTMKDMYGKQWPQLGPTNKQWVQFHDWNTDDVCIKRSVCFQIGQSASGRHWCFARQAECDFGGADLESYCKTCKDQSCSNQRTKDIQRHSIHATVHFDAGNAPGGSSEARSIRSEMFRRASGFGSPNHNISQQIQLWPVPKHLS